MRTRTLPAVLLVAVVVAGCTSAQQPTSPSSPRPSSTLQAPTEQATARRSCATPCRGRPRVVGGLPRREAPEASGIVASRRHDGVLYVLDDGPGTSSLLVIRADRGTRAGRIAVDGLDSFDSEALAAGACGRASCVYIGDIGDNLQSRDTLTVTRFTEPDINAADVRVAGEAIELRYPDRPHNAEALLADDAGGLIIVTKDEGRRGRGAARLYRSTGFHDQTLQRGPKVALPPPRLPLAASVVGNVVTGADSAAGRVVVRTYDALYEFTAPRPHAPAHRFASWRVREIASPAEPQGEAVAYGRDGCSIFTVSEDSGRLTSIPCRRERLPAAGGG